MALNKGQYMLINYFIGEIVLYDDEVKIYFNNPLKISPDKMNISRYNYHIGFLGDFDLAI